MFDLSELFLRLIVFLVLLVLLVLVLWYYQLYKYYNGLYKITGPKYIPVLGHVMNLKPEPETMQYIVDICKEHNGIAKLVGGFKFGLIVTDYKFTEFVLTSNTIIKKTFNYHFLKNWLGNGLILSDGAKWKSRRKVITPAFHFEILNQFIEVFESSSYVLVQKLEEEIDLSCKSLNMYDFIPYCTLDAICETAMRTKLDLQTNKECTYMTAVLQLTLYAMWRTIDPSKHNDFLYKFSNLYRQEKKMIEVVHNIADTVIKKRRQELKLQNPNEILFDEIGKKRKIAFIDILMQSIVDGEPLTDEDIREEVENFMFAGHDTTSEAICFTLYELARNPDIQKKVLEEQRGIYKDNIFKATTMKELSEMKYLEMVIKESMRLYPPLPSIAREVTEDFEYDGMLFKKGLNIILFTYGLHRNPKYFANPEKFDPERFSNENNLGLHPFSYIPFSAGPRNCIGQKFAFLEMKLIISKIIRNFELFPSPGHVLRLIQKVTIFSMSEIIIRLKKR